MRVDLPEGKSTVGATKADQVWAGPDFRQGARMQRPADLIEPLARALTTIAEMHRLCCLLLSLAFIASAARMAGTQLVSKSRPEVAAMVEKAVVIAVVDVFYEESQVRFDLNEVLFTSSPIKEKGTIFIIPRHEPKDLRRLTTLMFFPRFPPKNDDLVGFQLEGEHLIGAIPTLTEVKKKTLK